MKFILLFIAINQTPTQLGVYDNLQACRAAIRQIFVRQMTPQGVEIPPQTREMIEKAVDIQLQYDNKYQCQPQK